MIQELGKYLAGLGFILFVVGGVLWFSGKVPFLGKLPGDILVKRGNFTFYAPLATSLILSLVLTIVLTLIYKLKH